MRKGELLDLADCTEFRQTLQARPPRVVHGTALLLAALLAGAALWAGVTEADLVVRAAGRVRPVNAPNKVVNAGRGEVLSASAGGRVVEVNFQEGARVRRGDVLVRLDTERLDSDIARRRRTLRAAEEELERAARLEELLTRQHEAARAKLDAELVQALEEVRQAKERRTSNVKLAEVELETAADDHARLQQMVAQRAAAKVELVQAAEKVQRARSKLEQHRLPVDEGKVAILRRAEALAEAEHAARREEVKMRRGVKEGEAAAARIELAGLELERKQAALRAPLDGVVTWGEVKVGDVLETGKPVAEIAEQNGFRFEAAVASEDVAHLRVGMAARIRLDAYDYQRYGTLTGTVCFISPDSAVPQGQRTAVYLVKIAVDQEEVGRGDLRGRVRLGMAGQVEIVTGRESLLGLLLHQVRQTISLG